MIEYDTARPYTAAFVLIERDGKYLFVLRGHTTWMNNHYGLPSGKVEKREGFVAAAVREVKEEVGVTVRPENLEFAVTTWRRDARDDPDMEWMDVMFVAKRWEGEPYNAEPHMHDEIAWFGLDELPENTLPHIRTMLETYRRGEHYMELGGSVEK